MTSPFTVSAGSVHGDPPPQVRSSPESNRKAKAGSASPDPASEPVSVTLGGTRYHPSPPCTPPENAASTSATVVSSNPVTLTSDTLPDTSVALT